MAWEDACCEPVIVGVLLQCLDSKMELTLTNAETCVLFTPRLMNSSSECILVTHEHRDHLESLLPVESLDKHRE